MNHVEMWTDGSSTGTVGPGGYAAILKYGDVEREIVGGRLSDATNNTMELTAVLEGLRALRAPCRVTIYTDSKLVIGWLSQNWKCKVARCAAIRDQVFSLLKHVPHQLTFVHVAGHSGDEMNDRVDRLAVEAREGAQFEAAIGGI